jgi:hypothetical protein
MVAGCGRSASLLFLHICIHLPPTEKCMCRLAHRAALDACLTAEHSPSTFQANFRAKSHARKTIPAQFEWGGPTPSRPGNGSTSVGGARKGAAGHSVAGSPQARQGDEWKAYIGQGRSCLGMKGVQRSSWISWQQWRSE